MGHFRDQDDQKMSHCIDSICDSIRKRIALAVSQGRISYNTRWVYQCRNGRQTLLSEVKSIPCHCVAWLCTCEVNFMENRFFYDAKERIFTISEVDTLVWILKEVEQRLRADNIFPVDYQETEKWTVFGNRRIVTSGVRKVSLCGNETIRNLREAAEAYAAGYGRPDISTVIVNKFAYFIKEETKERK